MWLANPLSVERCTIRFAAKAGWASGTSLFQARNAVKRLACGAWVGFYGIDGSAPMLNSGVASAGSPPILQVRRQE
jgi:hypothetical protein